MKLLTKCTIGLISATWINVSLAIPISANSNVSFYHDLVIGGGGQLPFWLESNVGGPTYHFLTNSDSQSPDAVEYNDVDSVISGISPDSPSSFTSVSSDLYTGGAEGAYAYNNTQLYQVIQPEIIEGTGFGDVTQRGLSGGGAAQVSASTELFETVANSDVSFQRTFIFSNQAAQAMTFGIEGTFEMGIFANAEGEHSLSEAFATLDMFFRSSNVLDIVFAHTSPYTNSQTETGDNANMYFDLETDVASTGHLSLTGGASALGVNSPDMQQAFGNSSMSYALGITLQPGEEITMHHLIGHSNLAQIGESVTEVNEPQNLFVLSLMAAFTILRKRRLKLFNPVPHG